MYTCIVDSAKVDAHLMPVTCLHKEPDKFNFDKLQKYCVDINTFPN